jgi:predicted dehydrogenase
MLPELPPLDNELANARLAKMGKEATDARLSAVVIGAGGFGSPTLSAVRQCPLLRLVGVGDRDPSVAARAGLEAQAPHFVDNRALLAQTRPDVAFVAAPPAAAVEIVSCCAERGVHVWKELPLARNLNEGVAIVRRMRQAGLKLVVGTQRRFAAGYRRAWELRRRIGQVYLARAHYLFNWGPNLGWRGDVASAGGGALMELGYHPIDLMLWMLGLPEAVYGMTAVAKLDPLPGEGPPRLHDTDDTAAALLRYGQGRMASVVATRISGPVSEELSLHGRLGSITAGAQRCLLRDPDGNTRDRLEDDAAPAVVFARQVESFARAVASGQEQYHCSGLENLRTLAVIEATYLSDRTAQPESPARALKTHDLTDEECLELTPPDATPPDATAR